MCTFASVMTHKNEHKNQESQMLQAIREGDRKMYRLLFERYYPSLCAYGNRFVQLEEAQEIAQDSLLWLWEHREEVTIESSLSGYLLSMVYHRSVNLLLQNQARLKAENRYLKAVEEGWVTTFVEAGAVVSTPTCGPCLGGYMGILAEGERCVSTTNRNFVGRMGHITSEIYLASPAVAAASAVTGEISSPEDI